MDAFSKLFEQLDDGSPTTEKQIALEAYFRNTPAQNAAWGLWLLWGDRLKRSVTHSGLREHVSEVAKMPGWMIEECHQSVGDLAETLALLLPAPSHPCTMPLAHWMEHRLLPLAGTDESTRRDLLRQSWNELSSVHFFLWHKLVTGTFRASVSRSIVSRALASVAGVEPAIMAHRLESHWEPTAGSLTRLLSGETTTDATARTYPFCAASSWLGPTDNLGSASEWQIEWKWDGVGVQLIRRAGKCILWSHVGEILTRAFPEIADAARSSPDGTVLEGSLLAWRQNAPLPLAQLERRLHSKTAHARLRQEVPVVFMAYDLLESESRDRRQLELRTRRTALEKVVYQANHKSGVPSVEPSPGVWSQSELFPSAPATRSHATCLMISQDLGSASWDEVEARVQEARANGTKGVMLKHRASTHSANDEQAGWWKWEITPLRCFAVLVAVQPGEGQRRKTLPEYSFAAWQADQLVPIARICAELSNEEVSEVNAFVRAHTLGRFGRVHSVEPLLVFELTFEAVTASQRRRSGLTLRSPQIFRRRSDKNAADADLLETLYRLAGNSV